jgi:osmotically-inducible protein OsmY
MPLPMHGNCTSDPASSSLQSKVESMPAKTKPTASTAKPLEDRVQVALDEHPNLPKRNLRIEASDGRITLHGTVHSYYQKQMAQEVLRRLEGIQTIDNQLEVSWT